MSVQDARFSREFAGTVKADAEQIAGWASDWATVSEVMQRYGWSLARARRACELGVVLGLLEAGSRRRDAARTVKTYRRKG